MKVILTRQHKDCLQIKNSLKIRSKNFVVAPLLKIQHNLINKEKISSKAIALLTSKNAIPKLIQASNDKEIQRIISVGTSTSKKISSVGFKKVILTASNINLMLEKIKTYISKQEKIIYFRSNYITADIKKILSPDYLIEYIEAYKVHYVEHMPQTIIQTLNTEKKILFCFFSTKICEIFTKLAIKYSLTKKISESMCIVISKDAKKKISIIPWQQIIVPKYQTKRAMIKAIESIITNF